MFLRTASNAPKVLRVLAFGVRLEVHVEERALLPEVEAILPPTWTAAEGDGVDTRFSIAPVDDGYEVSQDGVPMTPSVGRGIAVEILDAQMRMAVATMSPRGAFIHAGCVAVDGRAVVLPGRSFAGKTTLVAEMIRRGATYLSDEFAVLDEDGLVHPYPKPLSIRPPEATLRSVHMAARETPAADLGADTGARALPIVLIAAARYRPAARWSPEPRSRAQGALILLSHALAARLDTERVLPIVRRAAAGAAVLEGDRGDAGEVAEALLAHAAATPGPAA